MRIAVIGAGAVGSALGAAWERAGHEVTFGVRDAADETSRHAAEVAPQSRLAAPAEAAHGADVIVLAVPWPAARPALAGLGDLAGKVLIDATNPLTPDFADLEADYTVSGAERVAAWAEGARVFKAFNQTGANVMGDPSRFPVRPVMFVAGDDAEGKGIVLRLIEEVGFEAIDAGKLHSARLLEPLAMLWIRLANAQGQGRDFALAVTRLPR